MLNLDWLTSLMKVIKSCLVTASLALACQPSTTDAERKQEVLDADRKFNQMANEKGIAEAFIYYADEKVIKPTPGKQPVVGKLALMDWYEKNPPVNEKLIWEPLRAEASGNL
jgi:hypothetical protein